MECYLKLNFLMILSVTACQLCTMDAELMHRLLGQKHIRHVICQNLSEKDLNRLSQANHQMRGYVEPVLETHMRERAINYSMALSAVDLDFHNQRRKFADNEAFRNHVLQTIRDFAKDNPGKWINLRLRGNNLGNDPAFFEQLMHDIIAVVHELKIDIAGLSLGHNELTVMPEHVFAGLTQLQELYLYENQLTTLPEHIFEKLTQLKELYLCGNQLTTLPEHVFAGLTQLQVLNLGYNQLTGLPERIFEGLAYLGSLALGENPIAGLPEHIFVGLTNLQELYVRKTNLTAIPEHLFIGLTKLKDLNLQGNKFSVLPENIFTGLTQLQGLYLDSNRLIGLPEHMFEGLTQLKKLDLRGNQLPPYQLLGIPSGCQVIRHSIETDF